MIHRCKYYKIQELVSERFYNKWGAKAWWFVDFGLAHDLDVIREESDASVTVNDWQWGGQLDASGLRQEGDEYFNPTSPHSFGRAADIKIHGMDSDQVRDFVYKLKREGKLKYITRMELETQGWVHIDTYNALPNDDEGLLYVFNP